MASWLSPPLGFLSIEYHYLISRNPTPFVTFFIFGQSLQYSDAHDMIICGKYLHPITFRSPLATSIKSLPPTTCAIIQPRGKSGTQSEHSHDEDPSNLLNPSAHTCKASPAFTPSLKSFIYICIYIIPTLPSHDTTILPSSSSPPN